MGKIDQSTLPFLRPFSFTTTVLSTEERQDIKVNLEKLGLEISYRDLKVLHQISKTATTAVATTEFLKSSKKDEENLEVDQFQVTMFSAEPSVSSLSLDDVSTQKPQTEEVKKTKKESVCLRLSFSSFHPPAKEGFCSVLF